jgi:hypothetical protein
MMMGTPMLAFGMGDIGQPSTVTGYALSAELPPIARRVNERILVIAAELVRHPLRTLAGQVRWQKAEIAMREAPQLVVTLRNTGRQPVQVPNPAGAAEDAATGLHVSMFAEGGETGARDSGSFTARRREITQLSPASADPGDEPRPVVGLNPGDELVLLITTRRHCYFSPGRYRAGVLLGTDAMDFPDEESVRGQIQAETGPLLVKKR